MYYKVKLQYLLPKEDTDEMKKENKNFFVNALSCAEAEGKILSWAPSNWQDTTVTGCTEANVIEIRKEFTESETWWEAIQGDENEKGKLVQYHVIINGNNHMEVIKKLNSLFSMSEFVGIKKINTIVDEDLIDEKFNPLLHKKSIEEEQEA